MPSTITIEVSAMEFQLFDKYFDCAKDYIRNIRKLLNNTVYFDVFCDDIDKFRFDMNSDIINNGLDHQQSITDLGVRLYKLFDVISTQL